MAEIKSTQTVARELMDGLRWFSRTSGQPLDHATLVHGGTDAYTRDGIAVRPWFAI